ncbi:sodium:solute symporter family transporter [Halobacillus amylolyticus]|uniref:Uncharacterized protein n=1 Tax=Halobacillus amylolyticus TaxID=2932259 RepID=A0ABY4HG48_9BACI|nr:hypothetical protein [Halobacillus amylolyticus]UOR13854.1 hypothetical protein MUO15_10655 [Halobacillus amylolyticus]
MLWHYLHKCRTIASLGTWLIWATPFHRAIYDNQINKRHSKGTPRWYVLDGYLFIWLHSFREECKSEKGMITGRIVVLGIACLTVLLGYDRDSKVLELVSYSWAGFGAALGPVIILSLFWKRMTGSGALAGVIAGTATVIIWKQAIRSHFRII